MLLSPFGRVYVVLDRAGSYLRLPISGATFTLQLGGKSPPPTTGTHGVISGVMGTPEYLAEFVDHPGTLPTDVLCNPFRLAAAQRLIRMGSDILGNGSHDPRRTCDALSIGLGFDASAARLGPALDKQPVPLNPCAP